MTSISLACGRRLFNMTCAGFLMEKNYSLAHIYEAL
jgi:hypothetical protein